MPTYEYACRSCGHTFEVVQAMRDETLSVCPECGGELRKVFAPPAISFKGSGFYATDHGKKSKQAAEKPADKTSEKKEAPAGTGKGEKKEKKESPKPAEKKVASGSGGSSGGSSSDGKTAT